MVKKHIKKNVKKQNGSGFTHNLSQSVGGLMERVGYSESCPPVYNNNQIVMENGQPMCGGSMKRRTKKKNSKKRNSKKRNSKKEYLLSII
jgi:hypothetical protein